MPAAVEEISTLTAAPANRLARGWPQVTAALLIIVEMLWVLPWYQTVMQITAAAPLERAALVLGGLMTVTYLVSYGMESLRLVKSLQMFVLVGLLVGGLVLAENLLLVNPALAQDLITLDPGAILVVFVVVWLWQRGFTLGRDPARPLLAWRRFELGLILFLAHSFIVGQRGETGPGMGWFVVFLFFGFSAVIFARVSYVGLSKGMYKNPFDRRWLATTLGILGLSILIAAFLGSLLTGQYRLLLVGLVEVLRWCLGVALYLVSLPGLLLSIIAWPFVFWLQGLMTKPAPTPLPPDVVGDPYPYPYPLPAAPIEALPLSATLQLVCFWGVIFLIVAVVLARVRQRLGEQRGAEPEDPESLLKRGEAQQLLRQALVDAVEDLAARFKPAQRFLAAARVRQIYASLMELCNALNAPRPPGKTPFEFLPVMGELFSEFADDLALITQVYVQVRYGEYPESPQQLAEIETAWLRILKEGQRLKQIGYVRLQTAESKEVLRTGV